MHRSIPRTKAHTNESTQFYQHLCDALSDLRQGYYTEFLRISSYEGTSSTGNVKLLGAGEKFYHFLRGKPLIIVEDIVDTGTTLSSLLPILSSKSAPESIEICSLITRRIPKEEEVRVSPKYVGFSIPDGFIIGYGLDYNEQYRDLHDIWIISQLGIDSGR